MRLKEEILRLHNEGKSYPQISKILNCGIGTISYHLNPNVKQATKANRDKFNNNNPLARKAYAYRYKRKVFGNKTRDYLRRSHVVKKSQTKSPKNPSFTYQDLLQHFGNNPTCYLTGEHIDLTKTDTYVFDHKVPVSKGGFNTLENLGLTTVKANAMKSDMLLEELYDMCEKVLRKAGRL